MAIIIFVALMVVGTVGILIFRSKSRANDRKRQEENARR
jgi:hypothetical protein